MIPSDLDHASWICHEAAEALKREIHRTALLIIDRGVLYQMKKDGLLGCKCLRNAIYFGEFRPERVEVRFA